MKRWARPAFGFARPPGGWLAIALLLGAPAPWKAGPTAAERPTILIEKSERPAFQRMLRETDWGPKILLNIRKFLDPYVDRHQKDPDWILDRLMLHWEKPYRTGMQDGKLTGDAEHPTVYRGGYGNPSIGAHFFKYPSLESIPPRCTTGLKLQLDHPDHPTWHEIKLPQLGRHVLIINGRILNLALGSAILHWITDEDKYAKFATDILVAFCRAGAQMEVVASGYGGFLFNGQPEWEIQALGIPIALANDFMHERWSKDKLDTAHIRRVLEKYVQLSYVDHPNPNKNARRAQYRILCGLAVEDRTEGQKAVQSGIGKLINSIPSGPTCLWREAPAYHMFTLGPLLDAAIAADLNGYSDHAFGYREDGERTKSYRSMKDMNHRLYRFAAALSRFSYPNERGTINFGDSTHVASQPPWILEAALKMARRHGHTDWEKELSWYLRRMIEAGVYDRATLTGLDRSWPPVWLPDWRELLFRVPHLTPTEAETFSRPRSDYIDFAPLYLQRNLDDSRYGLMCSAYGSGGGHAHDNGMAMELYGAGHVLCADPGTVADYSHRMHAYYKGPAAHTTVLQNVKDYCISRRLSAAAAEPAPGRKAISPFCSFSDLLGTGGAAEQRKLLALIRTSAKTGYYLDIYRSNCPKGNDYLYHNLGHSVELLDSSGQRHPMTDLDTTSVAPFDMLERWYKPFAERKSCPAAPELVLARFALRPGQGDETVYMHAWCLGDKERQFQTASAPPTLTAEAPYRSLPTPTLIVRQTGEAWTRPFVTILEPFRGRDPEAASVRRVSPIQDFRPAGNAVGVMVESQSKEGGLREGHREHLVYALDPEAEYVSPQERLVFRGIFGVACTDRAGLNYLYLGHGRAIAKDGISLAALGEKPVSACLAFDGEKWLCSASPEQVKVGLRHDNRSELPYAALKIFFRAPGEEWKEAEACSATPERGVTGQGPGTIEAVLPPRPDLELAIR